MNIQVLRALFPLKVSTYTPTSEFDLCDSCATAARIPISHSFIMADQLTEEKIAGEFVDISDATHKTSPRCVGHSC